MVSAVRHLRGKARCQDQEAGSGASGQRRGSSEQGAVSYRVRSWKTSVRPSTPEGGQWPRENQIHPASSLRDSRRATDLAVPTIPEKRQVTKTAVILGRPVQHRDTDQPDLTASQGVNDGGPPGQTGAIPGAARDEQPWGGSNATYFTIRRACLMSHWWLRHAVARATDHMSQDECVNGFHHCPTIV